MELTFNKYQKVVCSSMNPPRGLSFDLQDYSLRAVESVGVFSTTAHRMLYNFEERDSRLLKKLLEDCLYYLAVIASVLGTSLEEIAQQTYTRLTQQSTERMDKQ